MWASRGYLAQPKATLLVQFRSIMKQTRLRVVDNSIPTTTSAQDAPYCIHVYGKKKVARLGDTIKLTYKGKLYKAVVVSNSDGKYVRFDNRNNVVVVDDNMSPLGTRVKAPLPSELKGYPGLSKVLAIASKFV